MDLAVETNNILQNYDTALNLANDVDFHFYGLSELSPGDNKKNLSSTIKYIKNTGMFLGQHNPSWSTHASARVGGRLYICLILHFHIHCFSFLFKLDYNF